MEPLSEDDYSYNGAHNPYGTGRVKGAAYLETDSFVAAFRNYFKEHKILVNEAFDHSCFDAKKRTYRDRIYDGVIFCEGYLAFTNPLFHNLPIQCTKGETITIHCTDLQTKESLNRKCFVLPLNGKNQYRVGATYVWNTPDNQLTQEGRNELIEKFKVVSGSTFDLIDQQAGIRPTTPDRRPIIGEHEHFMHIYIFNLLNKYIGN
jgi:glycine/D-amino acid oxidase-like deaminating enzyme